MWSFINKTLTNIIEWNIILFVSFKKYFWKHRLQSVSQIVQGSVCQKLLIGNWKLGHWWLVEKLNKYILCSEDVERALFSAHSSTCLLAQVVKDVSAQMGRPRHVHSYLPFRLSAPVHELSSGNRKWTAQSTCHPGHHNPAPTLLNWRLLFGDILVFVIFPLNLAPSSGVATVQPSVWLAARWFLAARGTQSADRLRRGLENPRGGVMADFSE